MQDAKGAIEIEIMIREFTDKGDKHGDFYRDKTINGGVQARTHQISEMRGK
ncbi:hypothetical protein PKHYL_10580 [Psychrobacter sp. KH172YL61]|nr:hypothetical protein PKHYL_10580 [Psychrobacter sp. KH172YL61]